MQLVCSIKIDISALVVAPAHTSTLESRGDRFAVKAHLHGELANGLTW